MTTPVTGAARPRSAALDAVRVLAITAVVAGHTWNVPELRVWLYSWHVPVFFFLTGYLWRDKAMRTELRGRWRSMGRPYVVWLVVLLVAAVTVALVTGTFTADTVLKPLYAAHAVRPFTTFWFVGALFAAAVLYRAVRIGGARARWVEPAVLVAALLVAILFGRAVADTPLSVGTAIPCLLFVASGALFARLRVPLPVVTGAVLLGVSALLLATGAARPLDVKPGDYGTPVLSIAVAIAISAGLVLLAQRLFALLPAPVHRAVSVLALAGLVVVLLHPAAMWIEQGWRFAPVLAFFFALVATWAFGLLLLRLPAAGWTTGVDPHRVVPTR